MKYVTFYETTKGTQGFTHQNYAIVNVGEEKDHIQKIHLSEGEVLDKIGIVALSVTRLLGEQEFNKLLSNQDFQKEEVSRQLDLVREVEEEVNDTQFKVQQTFAF